MKRDKMRKDRGVTLLILIIVIAFLLSIGLLLLFVTGTGPEVANNVRLQERAFNAAEAGFDEAWRAINDLIISGTIADFAGHYRTKYSTYGDVLDVKWLAPNVPNPQYFRRITDEELVADMISDDINVLIPYTQLQNDSSLGYLVFLIDDEKDSGTPQAGFPVNDRDCIVVCIGRAGQNTYARIEVVIEIQTT
jgi:hypothetical protein